MEWPASFRQRYRPANSLEVRSWSFGDVSRPRDPEAQGWQQVRRSLDDQSIFGTKRDFECACGKYGGIPHRNMVCDTCGVKVADHDIRRQRFGHIELGHEVHHPFGQAGETIDAIPVLPATYWESPGGIGLADRYEDVIGAVASQQSREIVIAVNNVVEFIAPVALITHEWWLPDSQILAQGLALVRRDDPIDELLASFEP